MTKLEIRPGACGFFVMLTTTADVDKKVNVDIETDCEQVKELAREVEHFTIQDIFGFPFGEDRVYQAAKKVIRHAGCPVPCGIIKAIEAELGLAVKQDVLIHFFQE
jgi:hypothetical protein